MKRVVVLGSNSFSGAHYTALLLDNGYEVIGVSRSREVEYEFAPYRWGKSSSKRLKDFNFHMLDMNQDFCSLIDLLKASRPNYIVNFAAQGMVGQSWSKPSDWFLTNTLTPVRLFEVLVGMESLEKYVHITTPEVYGSSGKSWISENTNFRPSSPYATSRAACDMHLITLHREMGFPVVFTRAGNVYGEGQQLYRVIPRVVLSALTRSSFLLEGGGKSFRCFIHIDDVVKGTQRIMESGVPGSSWHLSNSRPIEIAELVKLVYKRCGVTDTDELIKETKGRLGHDDTYLLDSRKAKDMLNWEAEVGLEEGIDRVVNWARTNIDRLKLMSWDYQHKG